MGALLHDPPVLDHDNAIAIGHGRKPVRNGKHGPAGHDLVDGRLHHAFGLGVQRAGGLVENENGRIAHDRPCNGQPLSLASGQAHAALPDHRLVPLGQAADELVRVRSPRRLLDIRLRALPAPVGNVVRHGLVEQDRFLGHQPGQPPQRLQREIAQVPPVHRNPPAGHIEEPGQQVHKRGLACPRAADHGDAFSRTHLQVHVLQHRAVAVGKRHVLEADGLQVFRELVRVLPLLHAHVGVQDLENPHGRRRALLDVHVNTAEPLDGIVQEHKTETERDEVLERHLHGRRVRQRGDQPQGRHEPDHRLDQRLGPHHPHDPTEERPALGGEPFPFASLHGKRLHDPHAGDRLLHGRNDVRELFLPLLRCLPHFLPKPENGKNT